ncbi:MULTISPECIES: acetyl-CoA carboxylase biotin carboxyl carrier protein subunit [Enterococcus]|uniref:Lipoyl-binding domain-containing protein n=1 Tax=Enterococcus pallens ATCC BAA-351 TaxID=1158607 RepID=R2PVN6_9ENTE|nr:MULTISPECIES: acetyl-CoA carboxylase biotin carboxyl carrier protein subunit [Enterococcus]EOH88547.1 hypothetical protein UAU_04366 [Enterococcus pallens ATCC BAA-351]EOU17728.1 hypothetical protein I588_02715 [Enterococcus pallens ATCC BAA-351]
MLRKFKIAIDGTEYLVEMEEIGGTPAQAASLAAPAQSVQPPVQAAPVPVEASAPVTSQAVGEMKAASEVITAPMPGTVLKILVNVGDEIVANQPLLILEAMKMENEIVANKAGVVEAIAVAQGEMVNPGDSLIGIA